MIVRGWAQTQRILREVRLTNEQRRTTLESSRVAAGERYSVAKVVAAPRNELSNG
jgi:hypothetical protein